jgi:hypothetical protein
MKFFIYKIYAFAKTQEETAGVLIPFLGYMSIFEGLHILLFKVILQFYVLPLGFFSTRDEIPWYSGWIFVLVGFTLNYFLFIKTKWVYQIYDEYAQKGLKLWKSNLLFFLYIIFLFGLMFFLNPDGHS